MELIEYLKRNPTIFFTVVIITACICVIIMIVIILLRMESEKKVTKAALDLNKITNSIRAGLVRFILEDDCRILYASRGFYDLLGYDKREVRELNKTRLTDFIYPTDVKSFPDVKQQMEGDAFCFEVRLMTKEQKVLYSLVNGNSSKNREDKHIISAVIVDITEQKKMQEMILLEGERYRIASELSNDVLFEYHINTDEMYYAEKYKELFSGSQTMHKYVQECNKRLDLVYPDDWGIYLEYCRRLAEGQSYIEAEFRVKDRMNNYIWCQVMGKTIFSDEKIPVRVIGKIVNVDMQKRELEALEYKATRDPLTGVYNKEVTIKKIEKYINGNKNGKHILMFIDFDDFKKVNDNHGHLLGDKVLTYVIGRIRNVFSEGEIIGRVGGDEFVVFAGNIDHRDDILQKAETLVKALDTTYMTNGQEISISGSIGIASYPEDGLHYEQLIQCADKALYHVKQQGKNNYRLYTSSI